MKDIKNNSGFGNSGDYNSGDYNSGFRNSGNYNSGDYNSGYRNSGFRNSGNYNSGNYNSGDCNSGYRNSGFFNTNSPKVRLFNLDSELEFDSEIISNLRSNIFNNIKTVCVWIYEDKMSEKDKNDYPTYKTTGGYLKTRDYKYCWKKGWEKMSEEAKQAIKDLPNFCPKIFEEITGISIEEKKKVTLELTDEQLKQVQDLILKQK